MIEACFFMLAAIGLMLASILHQVKKIEKKIEDHRERPKHKRFWGWGGK